MLQQTQVSRVQEHFYPFFLKKYPTIQDLANASIDDIMASWSGLGYYSRARNLHKSAKLCKEHGLPQNMKELQTLFGVGKYTASAICSFGYHQKVPVVDTNISRVLKRYFALEDDKTIWKVAEQFLNTDEPTKHNLALMDLGSLVCTPKNPTCKECPLEFTCKGKHEPERFTCKKKTQYESLELFFRSLHKKQYNSLAKIANKIV